MELERRAEMAQQFASMETEELVKTAVNAIADRDSWQARAYRSEGKIAEAEVVLKQFVKDGTIDTEAAATLAEALEVSITRRIYVDLTVNVTGYLELELGEDIPENNWDYQIDRLDISTTDGTNLDIEDITIMETEATEADE